MGGPAGQTAGVLITAADAAAIERGAVTVMVRRWKRPQAKVGGVYRTMAGWLRVVELRVVAFSEVSANEVAAAGWRSAAELAERFGIGDDDEVHVLRIERCDAPDRPDPGADAEVSEADVADLRARLDAMDERSPTGAWTHATLEHIADHPGTRSADMAEALGREQAALKADVRKLKRLGLTRPLERGYELSPRGRAFLDAAGAAGP